MKVTLVIHSNSNIFSGYFVVCKDFFCDMSGDLYLLEDAREESDILACLFVYLTHYKTIPQILQCNSSSANFDFGNLDQ